MGHTSHFYLYPCRFLKWSSGVIKEMDIEKPTFRRRGVLGIRGGGPKKLSEWEKRKKY